jgi:hypothetical protein
MSDYWGGCDYPIVLNTESKIYSLPIGMNFDVSVHHYESGNADLWGARLISTLNDTSAKFIIMLFDDYFLNGPVDQERLKALVDLMSDAQDVDVAYLIKLPCPQTGSIREDGLAVIAPNVDYRLNSAPAIWRKEALLKFTGRKDNPWAWEYFGSYRTFSDSSTFLKIADSEHDIYPYDYRKGGAIYRGKWVLEVISSIIEKHHLDLDIQKRGTDDSSCYPKRSLAWKYSFVMTGVQMIGPRIFSALYRIFRVKALSWLKKRKSANHETRITTQI